MQGRQVAAEPLLGGIEVQIGERKPTMRILGLAIAGLLVLLAAIPSHADPPGSKMRPVGLTPGIPQPDGASGSRMHQVPGGGGSGCTRTPVIRANGAGIGLVHIGRRPIIMARGVRPGYGAVPILSGEAPTFPTAATVTGARCGIP